MKRGNSVNSDWEAKILPLNQRCYTKLIPGISPIIAATCNEQIKEEFMIKHFEDFQHKHAQFLKLPASLNLLVWPMNFMCGILEPFIKDFPNFCSRLGKHKSIHICKYLKKLVRCKIDHSIPLFNLHRSQLLPNVAYMIFCHLNSNFSLSNSCSVPSSNEKCLSFQFQVS